MTRIGIIYTSYGMADYLPRSLGPWTDLKYLWHHDLNRRLEHQKSGADPQAFLPQHSVIIAVVSLPFKDCSIQNDGTQELLQSLLKTGKIDHLFTDPLFLSEWEARDLALQVLLKDGCELAVMCDGDEGWDIEKNILPSLAFIESQPFIAWFKASYKNYIWDEHHYLVEPFTPPRWYRTKVSGFTLSHFTYDNDVAFKDSQGNIKPHLVMPHITIPASISLTSHWTWLNNENSRRKIAYQTKARGWECSYRWDEENNRVAFNLDFYRKTGQNVPEVREEA